MTSSKKVSDAADELRVAGGLGRELWEFVESYGISLPPFLDDAGIDADDLTSFTTTASLARFCRLFEALTLAAKDEAFGLKYAVTYTPGGTGLFGYGLANAPTLREGLQFTKKYIGVIVDLASINLDVEQQRVRIEWTYSPLLLQREQFNDFAAALTVKHMRQCVGSSRWLPQEVHLDRKTPRTTAPYRDLLSPTVVFEAPSNAIIVSRDSLELDNPNADKLLHQLMCHQCDLLLQQKPQDLDLVEHVRNEVLALVGQPDITTGLIADRLAMSERSLQRRLAERGHTFQTIHDQIRREFSDRLLAETDLSLSDIAAKLGFSSPSTYTRSANRWYGRPPNEVRAETRSARTGR